MKPRDFLNFFKTKSGKLLLFVVVFGGGLWLFSTVRNRTDRGTAVAPLGTNQTDKPQIVQTVERPMQPVHPPPPKPEPPPPTPDRKSTRLNSSHSQISYAVFCLKKKNTLPA